MAIRKREPARAPVVSVDDDDDEPNVDYDEDEHGQPLAAPTAPTLTAPQINESERLHARRRARRELANGDRFTELSRYKAELEAVRNRHRQIYSAIGTESHDLDLLSEGLTGFGEQFGRALELELATVTADLELAEHPNAPPRSCGDLRSATSAVLVVERKATIYRATASVYKVPSNEIADSDKRKVVRAAVKARLKRSRK